MQQFYVPSGFTPANSDSPMNLLGGTPMSEIIDASFFSEYSPKFSPTDVFSSPRARGSSGRKQSLPGTGNSGIAMTSNLESKAMQRAAGSPERSSPLDVLATVSAEKAEKPKSGDDAHTSGGGGGPGTNIASEMDSGGNVSNSELDLSSPAGQGQSNDLSMDVHSNEGQNSLHNLSLSALEPLGIDDSHIDAQSDTDSPLLGARLNEYSVDRTGLDTSSICLSSSLADVSMTGHNRNGGGTVSRSQHTATKRKLQNISSALTDASLSQSTNMR